MMKYLLLAILVGPLFTFAQDKGVKFEKMTNLEKIIQKAKNEHKFIFIDCYASWCGPCKWMDQHVYSNRMVGEYVNQLFISVKLQMDSTDHDDSDIQQQYATARMLARQFRIQEYPSFLFLSPEGQIVHKAVGAEKVEDFLNLTKASRDPEMQFYTLIDRYYRHQIQYDKLEPLALAAHELSEDSLSGVIAKDYLFNYLTKMHQEGIWSREDLRFMLAYSHFIHYKDLLFRDYMTERSVIDSILGGSGESDRFINKVVYNDEILPSLNRGLRSGREPAWARIGKAIIRRYGRTYAISNVLKGQVEYYKERKDWANYSKYFVRQVEATNIENWPASIVNSAFLNNDAFEVFQYSFDTQDLRKALTWVDLSLSMNAQNPDALDTKANLLYKLGRKAEGLAWEAKSYEMAPSNKDIEANYTKMKNGLPTWEGIDK